MEEQQENHPRAGQASAFSPRFPGSELLTSSKPPWAAGQVGRWGPPSSASGTLLLRCFITSPNAAMWLRPSLLRSLLDADPGASSATQVLTRAILLGPEPSSLHCQGIPTLQLQKHKSCLLPLGYTWRLRLPFYLGSRRRPRLSPSCHLRCCALPPQPLSLASVPESRKMGN